METLSLATLRCALRDSSAGSGASPPLLLPWAPPNREAFSRPWSSAGGRLVQPETLAGLLLYSVMEEEEERGLCACDVENLTVALLSAPSRAKHVTGDSGKSHGFMHIDFNSGP